MILIEITEWKDNIPNHIYILNNNNDRIDGYFNVVKQELFWFSKPQRFDRRGRTFKSFDYIINKEDNMTGFQFTAVMNAINQLPKNTNFNKILKDDYGITTDYSKQQAKFICQYILQGSAKGLEGKELIDYALKSQRELFDRFPHLKEDIIVENKTNVTNMTPAKESKTTKTKTVKQTKKAAKVNPHKLTEEIVTNTRVITTRKHSTKTNANKPRYADYSIVFCPKRNGYNGFVANKAEAFRDTVEKVQKFFMKKYATMGTIVE